jgi:hypothetical protein
MYLLSRQPFSEVFFMQTAMFNGQLVQVVCKSAKQTRIAFTLEKIESLDGTKLVPTADLKFSPKPPTKNTKTNVLKILKAAEDPDNPLLIEDVNVALSMVNHPPIADFTDQSLYGITRDAADFVVHELVDVDQPANS